MVTFIPDSRGPMAEPGLAAVVTAGALAAPALVPGAGDKPPAELSAVPWVAAAADQPGSAGTDPALLHFDLAVGRSAPATRTGAPAQGTRASP